MKEEKIKMKKEFEHMRTKERREENKKVGKKGRKEMKASKEK